MKLAIAGMGVAGSFLFRLLSKAGYTDIDCYEVKQKTACKIASCAFGVYRKPLLTLLKLVNLNAEKYILNLFDEIYVDGVIASCDLCTINKPQLLKDLIGEQKVDILDDGEKIFTDNAIYDLVVDATGYARAYLPPIKDDLVIPTVQYRVRSEEYLPPRMDGGGLGYGWIFELGNNEYHIGLGSLNDKPAERFKKIYGDLIKKSEVICKCKSHVRLLTPKYAMPIVSGNIVGVGEAAGAMVPMCGAGIITSMEAAKLLANNIENIPQYEKEVISKFKYLDVEAELIRKARNGGNPSMWDSMKLLENSKKAGIFLNAKTLLALLRKQCKN